MKSLEGKLGQLIQEMTPNALHQYRAKTKGGETVEALLNIAESCTAEFPVRESHGRIRRNNGASSYAEHDPTAESDAMLMEAICKKDPAFARAMQVKEQGESLTPAQESDVTFMTSIGLTRNEALKVIREGGLRD